MDAGPDTGLLVLNYHQAEQTAQCVASLLEREPATSRILWIENDSSCTFETLMACLERAPFPWVEVDPESGPLPAPGTVGVILCPENLGYAGGNNVGLRMLHRLGVPFAWVLNNDTLLVAGNSALLAEAARACPDVGAWGTVIRADHDPPYFGGIVRTRDFGIRMAGSPGALADPMAFVSGCSLFVPLAVAAEVGFLPDDYFLYYEDPSFSLLIKRAGYRIDGLWTVEVHHLESLSTGRRSQLLEFYNQRNRWFFIERFFPGHLRAQMRRALYTLQKYLFRGQFGTLHLRWAAFRDYRRGRLGRTHRRFSTAAGSGR